MIDLLFKYQEDISDKMDITMDTVRKIKVLSFNSP